MIINTINSNNTGFKGYKPLNEYKGPILKLTVKDKKKINELSQKIADIETEIYKICNFSENNHKTSNYWQHSIDLCKYRIGILQNDIQSIKQKRFEKQKARYESKNLDLNG